ncbi:hypothetical protein CCYA_CCYA18G4576 [Cyanidiococcus yangmingshanensis]|nr:hypothetical protein CCYA_CCYA18G4576 [Cyanidiococcus yangmingshanensis]
MKFDTRSTRQPVAPFKKRSSSWLQLQLLYRGLWSETLHPPRERDRLFLAGRQQRLRLFAQRSRAVIRTCCRRVRQRVLHPKAEREGTLDATRWIRLLADLDRLLRYLRKLLARLDVHETQRWARMLESRITDEMLTTTDELERMAASSERNHEDLYEWLLRVGAWREVCALLANHPESADRGSTNLYMKAIAYRPSDGRAYFAIGCALGKYSTDRTISRSANNTACMDASSTRSERVLLARAYWYIRACFAEEHPQPGARKRLVGLTRQSRLLASTFFEQTAHCRDRPMENPQLSLAQLSNGQSSSRSGLAADSTYKVMADEIHSGMMNAWLSHQGCIPFERICEWIAKISDSWSCIDHESPVIQMIAAVIFIHADAERVQPIWQMLRCCCLHRIDPGVSILADYIATHPDLSRQPPSDALVFLETRKMQWIRGLSNDNIDEDEPNPMYCSAQRLDPVVIAAVDDFCDAFETKSGVQPHSTLQRAGEVVPKEIRRYRAALPEERLFQGYAPLTTIYAHRVDLRGERSLLQDAKQALGHTSVPTADLEATFAGAIRLRKLELLASCVRRQAKWQMQCTDEANLRTLWKRQQSRS